MGWYADWVRGNVLLSAFVQFAVLGLLLMFLHRSSDNIIDRAWS